MPGQVPEVDNAQLMGKQLIDSLKILLYKCLMHKKSEIWEFRSKTTVQKERHK